MKSDAPLLECLLGEKIQRLDRHPALTSSLVTMALLLVSSRSTPVFEQWAASLFPALEWVTSHWSWALALILLVAALLLEPIAAGLGKAKDRLLSGWEGPLLIGLLVLVGVLFGVPGEVGQGGRWFLGLGIWSFLYALRHERAVAPDITTDHLHRQFLVERLVRVIDRGQLVKIALLGAWGTGKTVVLKLLQSELAIQGTRKWRMDWANPWNSASSEEAWLAIAGSINSALGNKPLFPPNWVQHPVLAWLAGVIPHANVTPELVRFFSERPSTRSAQEAVRSINRKIQSQLNHKDERLIIFVDDMERADPAVLRGLLPVIDRLHEIERCQFVFAIDPSRVADAFEEKGKNAPLTKGYLDKVFDLQLPLPAPRDADIRAMITQKAQGGSTPILAAALGRIDAHISPNPRLALRFFEVAKAKEVMFLQRLTAKEIPAAQFFLGWMIETEFKSFHESILQPHVLELFNQVCLRPLMEGESPSEDPEFPKLIDLLSQTLLEDKRSPERPRLASLVAALAGLIGNSLDWHTEVSTGFSLRWIADGHTRLEELSISELGRVREAWRLSAGTVSIQEIVRQALARTDYCDEVRCGEQLLAAEADDIIAASQSASRPGTPEDALTAIPECIERLNRHFNFAWTEGLVFDQQLFGEEFFYRWLGYFVSVPQEALTSDAGADMSQKREKLHLSMAQQLPMPAAFAALNHKLRLQIDWPHLSNHSAELKKHADKLREAIMKRVTRGILEMFRDGRLARRVPSDLPIDDPRFFSDPARWLWLQDGAWKTELANLESEAGENRAISEACSEIAGDVFIHPAACAQCAGGHQKEREALRKVAHDSPEYLQFIWGSAMKLGPESEKSQRLLRERKRAAEAGFIDPLFLDTHFPLPPDGQFEGDSSGAIERR